MLPASNFGALFEPKPTQRWTIALEFETTGASAGTCRLKGLVSE